MKLPRDLLSGLYRKPDIYLCETDKTRICKLDTTNTKTSFKFNSFSELNFDIARVYNNLVTGETKVNPYYDKIEALRLIELDDFGFFELQGPELVRDGIKEQKSCTAYSLEYTLSQKFLENFKVNTGAADSIEVYRAKDKNKIVPIVLYDPSNKELSLLHIVIEKAYGWKIGHVDRQLQTLTRQFEIDRESVYDFLMNEVCEKFNCYVVFDTFDNTINLYAESPTAKFIGDGKTNTFTIGSEYADEPLFSSIQTVSVDGYKTTLWSYVIEDNIGILYLDETPPSGSIIEAVGIDSTWETNVFITFNNLSEEIKVNYDADNIKTVLSVTYGDDYDIREVNLGLPYLTDLSYYYNTDWMGQDLYDAYTSYLNKSNAYQKDYANNSKEILKINDKIYYEENRLSLNYTRVVDIDKTTVGTYYIKTENSDGSFYYTEVSLPGEYKAGTNYYSNSSTNLQDGSTGNVRALYDVLKKYYYNYFNKKQQDKDNEKDELYETFGPGMDSAIEELRALNKRFSFMQVYTIDNLATDIQKGSEKEKESAIITFLNYLWIEVGRTPLNTLYLTQYKTLQDINVKAGWAQVTNGNYNNNYGNYYPVVLFINSIEYAISQRDQIIDEYEEERKIYSENNAAISEELNMTNPDNFTESQLIRLNSFLREDELHLDDIVQTSLDNLSSSFKIKRDAMESGRIELKKLSAPQLQFSMTMANIYALPEFEPIIDQFQLGRMIKIGLRNNYIKQSRLLQVDINFDDFSDFSCEFGELTNLRTQSDIHADLLSNAISAGKSVASNSGHWTQGADKATSTDLKIQQGLLDATTQIKAMDGTQGVVIDKYGIKCQKKNDNGEIDPHQLWITNNMLLYSDDAFQTSRSAFGQITVDGSEYYGLIAEMVLSGYIEGSHIYGGTIKIGEYTGTDGEKHYAFEVDENGNVIMSAENSIGGYVTDDEFGAANTDLNGKIETAYSNFTKTAEEIKLEVGGVKQDISDNYATKEHVASAVKIEKDSIISTVTSTVETNVQGYVDEQLGDYAKTSDVNGKFLDYYTKTETDSAITQTADSIKSTVTKDVTTEVTGYVDGKLVNYSTTLQVESMIDQQADSITNTVKSNISSNLQYYGTCDSLSNTTSKSVTCSDFVLETGAMITVKFTYANSAEYPMLNVNSTGAKYIYAYGKSISNNNKYNLSAGSFVTFIYDGTNWNISDAGSMSTIKQTAESITSRVETVEGTYTELKQTVDGFDLTGVVHFSDLSEDGDTVINGSNITTGIINAIDITGCNITSSETNNNYKINMNGGVLSFYNAKNQESAKLYAKKYNKDSVEYQNFYIDGVGDITISASDDLDIYGTYTNISGTYTNLFATSDIEMYVDKLYSYNRTNYDMNYSDQKCVRIGRHVERNREGNVVYLTGCRFDASIDGNITISNKYVDEYNNIMISSGDRMDIYAEEELELGSLARVRIATYSDDEPAQICAYEGTYNDKESRKLKAYIRIYNDGSITMKGDVTIDGNIYADNL